MLRGDAIVGTQLKMLLKRPGFNYLRSAAYVVGQLAHKKKAGFKYRKMDYRYTAVWKDGQWGFGNLVCDNTIEICEAATSLHYAQECFEGLKVVRAKDRSLLLFRPHQHASRINSSCRRLLMPEIPEEMFISACRDVARANEKYVPPYGSGGALYLRPMIIGTGGRLGVGPSQEYMFRLFCGLSGPYLKDFKGGFGHARLVISEYDRVPPAGTGSVKVGGNYAASLMPHKISTDAGFTDCLYLDSRTHTYIEETGCSNFLAITRDGKLVAPKSESILPGITTSSIIHIAKEFLGMEVETRQIPANSLGDFSEAIACGTATGISPILSITYGDMVFEYGNKNEIGPVTKELNKILLQIQYGEIKAPEGWILEI